MLPSSRRTFPRVHRQLRVYVDRVLWVTREGLRAYWPRILGVTALNTFGVLATAAVFLGVAAFARHLEKGGEPQSYLGIELAISTDAGALARSIAALALMGVLGALALYAAEWQIARIAAAYQRKCSLRLLAIAADPRFAGWQGLVDDAPRWAIQRLNSAARITAFALRNVLRGILPVIVFIIAAAALIGVDPGLTAMLAPLVLVYLVPLYFINRGVARQQRAYKEAAPQAKRLLGEGLRLIDSGEPAEAKLDWAAVAWDPPEHEQAARLFWKRRLANQRVQALNLVFFTVCLLGLFGFFGVKTQAPEGERTWAEFLVFIVALRFVFYGVRQVTARLVKLSRFLPEYRAYTEFVDEAEGIRAGNARGGAAALPDVLVFRCGRDGQWGSVPRLRMQRSQSVVVLTPHRVTHGMLEAAAVRMAGALKEPADILRRSNLLAQSADSVDAIVSADRETSIGDSGGERMAPRADSGRGRYRFIIVDDAREALQLLEEIDRDGGSAAGVAVLEDRDIIACGDREWLAANLRAIEEHLIGARAAEVVEDDVELEDDEDEEE